MGIRYCRRAGRGQTAIENKQRKYSSLFIRQVWPQQYRESSRVLRTDCTQDVDPEGHSSQYGHGLAVHVQSMKRTALSGGGIILTTYLRPMQISDSESTFVSSTSSMEILQNNEDLLDMLYPLRFHWESESIKNRCCLDLIKANCKHFLKGVKEMLEWITRHSQTMEKNLDDMTIHEAFYYSYQCDIFQSDLKIFGKGSLKQSQQLVKKYKKALEYSIFCQLQKYQFLDNGSVARNPNREQADHMEEAGSGSSSSSSEPQFADNQLANDQESTHTREYDEAVTQVVRMMNQEESVPASRQLLRTLFRELKAGWNATYVETSACLANIRSQCQRIRKTQHNLLRRIIRLAKKISKKEPDYAKQRALLKSIQSKTVLLTLQQLAKSVSRQTERLKEANKPLLEDQRLFKIFNAQMTSDDTLDRFLEMSQPRKNKLIRKQTSRRRSVRFSNLRHHRLCKRPKRRQNNFSRYRQ